MTAGVLASLADPAQVVARVWRVATPLSATPAPVSHDQAAHITRATTTDRRRVGDHPVTA